MVRGLTREATVARPGFNRWLVPPAAIAVHMCIGQVYNPIFYLMAGLLGLGLIPNLLVRPVDSKYHLPQTPEPPPP